MAECYNLSTMSYIGLIDCNNFFVSCERIFRPDLKNRPVVVLSSNDGCVVARSQEIKDMGIQMGVPYFQVKDILKDSGSAVFSSNFTLYRDISKRVFEVVRKRFPLIEQYSIDECFFNIGPEDVEAVAGSLRSEILQEIGIPVSIGIAKSKTIAKYASKLAKETDGVCLLKDTDWTEITPTIRLGEIWGVGSGRTRQFSSHQINTVSNLCSLPSSTVLRLFGKEGLKLWSELSQVSVMPVSYLRPKQMSIMSSRSLREATLSKTVLAEAISFHAHQIVTDLHLQGSVTSLISVFIYPSRHGDFALSGATLSTVLEQSTNDLFVIEKQVIELFESIYKSGIPYKRVGVVAMNLVDKDKVTLSLFGAKTVDGKTNILTQTVLNLNQRFGKNMIGLGRLSGVKNSWQAKQDMKSEAYTTDWRQLKRVLAK